MYMYVYVCMYISKAHNTQVGDKPHTRTHPGVGTRETASPMYGSARLWCAPSSLTLWGNTRPTDKGSGELPKKLGSHPDAHATEGHVTPAILACGPQTGDDRKPGSESEPGDGYRTHQAPAKAIGRLAKKKRRTPRLALGYIPHTHPAPSAKATKRGFWGTSTQGVRPHWVGAVSGTAPRSYPRRAYGVLTPTNPKPTRE